MRILVCIKEIQNPELPSELFRVDEENREVIPVRDMPLVTSPFDEQAIEAALRIRDRIGEAGITVVTFGPKTAQAVLKRALSMGADSGILISSEDCRHADAFAIARTLCRAIKQSGEYDLILAGRQAADWDAGIVGCGIGEILGIAVVTLAKDVQVDGDRVVVERVLDEGTETVETRTPCVVTIANELGEPRKASLRETMRAARKPIVTFDPGSLEIPAETYAAESARQVRDRLFVPVREGECEMFSGPTPRDIALQITERLREGKYL